MLCGAQTEEVGVKYGIFILVVTIGVPALSFVAAQSRKFREGLFGLIVFSTLFVGSIDINFMARMWYKAMSQGIQYSFVDILTWILLLSSALAAGREGKRLNWPPSLGLLLLFFVWSSINVAISWPQLFGMFQLNNMVRGLLVFLAAAWYYRSPRDLRILVVAVIAVLVYQGGLSILQRYVWNEFRVTGSLHHPNALADYCSMLAPIALAVAFSNASVIFRALCGIGWMFGGIAVVLSISRMGALLFALGTGAVLVSNLRSGITVQRIALGAVLVAVGAGLIVRGWDKISGRHEAMTTLEDRGDATAGRWVYYEMGFDIANQHPFGVGLNNWSWHVSAEKGQPYESVHSRGEYGKRAIFAHSYYMLVLGELGYPGFLIMIAIFLRWAFMLGKSLLITNNDPATQAYVGMFVMFIIMCAYSVTECSLASQHMIMIVYLVYGMGAAASQAVRTADPRGAPASADAPAGYGARA